MVGSGTRGGLGRLGLGIPLLLLLDDGVGERTQPLVLRVEELVALELELVRGTDGRLDGAVLGLDERHVLRVLLRRLDIGVLVLPQVLLLTQGQHVVALRGTGHLDGDVTLRDGGAQLGELPLEAEARGRERRRGDVGRLADLDDESGHTRNSTTQQLGQVHPVLPAFLPVRGDNLRIGLKLCSREEKVLIFYTMIAILSMQYVGRFCRKGVSFRSCLARDIPWPKHQNLSSLQLFWSCYHAPVVKPVYG